MASPNMGMTIPSPLVTTGPAWAEQISADLLIIDGHDHTSGSGVKVPSAGININADLQFNSHAPTELRATIYEEQVSDPAEDASIYFKDGDLYIKNVAGQVVQITDGTSVNAGSGSISGLVAPASASYSAITKTFVWLWDTDLPARQVMSNISLYEFNNASAAPIILASAAGTSTYTWTFPDAVAPDISVIYSNNTGDIGYVTPVSGNLVLRSNSAGTAFEFSQIQTANIDSSAVQTNNIADGNVTLAKLFPRTMVTTPATEGNVVYGNFSANVTSTSPQNLVTLVLSTRGRPCMVLIEADKTGTPAELQIVGQAFIRVSDGTSTSQMALSTGNSQYWSSIVMTMQPAGAGSHTFLLDAYVNAGGQAIIFSNFRFTVYEL